MTAALSIMPLAIEIAFVLLTVAVLVDWIQHRDLRHGYLALAFGSLTLLILLAPSLGPAGGYGSGATDTALALFLLSGFGLLMFRDSFLPMGRAVRIAVTLVIIAVLALGIAAELPADPQSPHSPFQALVLAAILTTWGLCVAEPTVTFWLASRNRPAVEGARIRALSLGYAGLVAVVLVGTLGGEAVRNPSAELVLDVVTIAMVPLLYFSFFPPPWLRRIWSQSEEEELRHGLHDLLTHSPDKSTQARRALGWATRLVGAKGAFIVDPDGSLLAVRGMSDAEAGAMAATTLPAPPDDTKQTHARPSTLVVPLELHDGRGAMVIVPGAFTPMFGDHEVRRLHQYGSSITASLDRVSLNQRIAALERAKTDFLNIASHELRGPMTVIKGYLTMLDGGSFGYLPPKAIAVLPLLISKADEVNSMIEQMIEAARLEEGRLALKKESADLVELTEMAIADVTPLLAKHEVKLDKPPLPIAADVDPDRFQIVVKNLITNAAKYSEEGRPITVKVIHNGTTGTVLVIDEGVGISNADQARLFTKFARIESGATMHVSGAGLGLWLSREIARMHDGDLTVESEPGKGSTFSFRVPITH
ncbi:MAG TPA: HAMP domain-containing sensor histidine kinase [Candidatus Dormibacteraeota bacterium]